MNLWYSERTLERLEVSASYTELAWMSKKQNQSWNLLEPRSFDAYMNVAVPIIVMLDHSEIDIETLDVDIEITEFNDCRKMLEDNWDTNDILAVIQEEAKFSAKIVGNLSTHLSSQSVNCVR